MSETSQSEAIQRSNESNAINFEDVRLKELLELRNPGDNKPLSALCISGGGIRSATFALGVLQELAKRGILDQLDYLSTVSGGGYIGSWLSAYRHHQPKSFEELLKKPTLPVTKTPEPETTTPEPEPIQFLRTFSNYLTPKLGLFSADTWTVVSTYLRNLTLNWLVLIPALLGGLLLPRLLFSFSVGLHAPSQSSEGNIARLDYLLLITGLISGIFALAFIGRNQPVNRNTKDGQGRYLWCCLLPLLISGFSLTTFWAHVFLQQKGKSATIFPLKFFCWFGIAFHLGGWIVGWFLHPSNWTKPARPTAKNIFFKFVLPGFVVAGTGVAGGWMAWFILCKSFPFWYPFFTKSDAIVRVSFLPSLYFCLATPIFVGIIGLVGILYAGVTTKRTSDQSQEWLARSGAWMTLGCLGWIGISGIVFFGPPLLVWLEATLSGVLLGGSGLLATLLGKSAKTSANTEKEKSAKTWTSILTDNTVAFAAPVFIILFLAALSFASNWMMYGVQNFLNNADQRFENNPLFHVVKFSQTPAGNDAIMLLFKESSWLVIVIAFGVMMFISNGICVFLDINRYSMQGMYRNRLVRAYLGASRSSKRVPNPFTGFDPKDDFRMACLKMREGKFQKPFHIVNCALNLVGGKTLAWQQRKAMSFTISPLHSGSCLLSRNSTSGKNGDISIPKVDGCYRNSKDYGEGITLGTAVGISGAAASPNMGYHSSPTVTFLLTLFNVRLGWWLGNPNSDDTFTKSSPRFYLGPLLRELFGLTDATYKYVNLSDGGHFENLGLYEMVLRRCKLVIVSDAGADPDFKFEDLGNAIRKIRADQGVDINFKTVPIYSRHNETTTQRGYCAIGEIDYPARYGTGEAKGYLLYLKPTLKPDDQAIPADVRNYASANKGFPHQSTGDQFFDESQFESYRALGQYVADRSLTEISTVTKPTIDQLAELLQKKY